VTAAFCSASGRSGETTVTCSMRSSCAGAGSHCRAEAIERPDSAASRNTPPLRPRALLTAAGPQRICRADAARPRLVRFPKRHQRKLLEQDLRGELAGVGGGIVLRRDLDHIGAGYLEAAQTTQQREPFA